MRAVTMTGFGDVDVLAWTDVPDPQPGPGEVVIDVVASAVNRADLLQRQGLYPPPPGASEILGMECSGRIGALGAGVDRWSVGDEVCALLAGGGYAEKVAVPAGQCMATPSGVDLATAAALPEVCCTIWSSLVQGGRLQRGEGVLVHGGASGIGTMAIQVARALGAAPVVATAGTAAKLDACRELGAHVAVNYHDEDFVAATQSATDGRGADIVLDIMGAAYLARNIDVLAADGRLVVIGLQGGLSAELNLGAMLPKRATLYTPSLRGRPLAQKAVICSAVVEVIWPLIERGDVRPVVHAAYPMDRAAEAHRLVADSGHIGKVLLTVPGH